MKINSKFAIAYLIVCSLFIGTSLNAQCGNGVGGVFINELGNNERGTDAEYIELVVYGSSGSPSAPVDLRGWIIDDNNMGSANIGNEPGHIRLGSCFGNVPPGTIILIYNGDVNASEIDPLGDGVGSGDGVIQLPISDPCFIKHNGCPTHTNSGYDCPPDASQNGPWEYSTVWSDYIPMRNLGDGIQVRDDNMQLVHGIYWGNINFPSGSVKMVFNSAMEKSIQFIGDENWTDVREYDFSIWGGSPGQPNSVANANLIQNLLAGGMAPNVLDITCEVVQRATGLPGPDGILGIEIDGGIAPLGIRWEGPSSGEMIVECTDYVSIEHLPAGNYEIQVESDNGCVASCNIEIITGIKKNYVCPDFLNNPCENQLLNYLTSNFGDLSCEQWIGDECGVDGLIYRSGMVGINTQNVPPGYLLAVNGGVITNEIIVELCESGNWCDYVFEDDYDLWPLEEVNDYIKDNGHLPRTISQQEVIAEEGFELKKVKLDQQEKIEEVFLHLIAMNDKVKMLSAKIGEIRTENKLLRNAQKN